MSYVGLLYQDLLRTGAVSRGKPLPPVVPVVLYNGQSQKRGQIYFSHPPRASRCAETEYACENKSVPFFEQPEKINMTSFLSMIEPKITIDSDDLNCVLTLITPEEYYDYYWKSVPVDEDCWFHLVLDVKMLRWAHFFGLPHMYAALRTLFGETTVSYDGYKCSFGYDFKLEVLRSEATYLYTMSFSDYKGGPYFVFRKVPCTTREWQMMDGREILLEPLEDEFSKAQMRHLMCWFLGYLKGLMGAYGPQYTEEFSRINYYCKWEYGFRQGEFFQYRMVEDDEV